MTEPVAILLLEDSPLDAELSSARLAKATFPLDIDRVDSRAAFCEALDKRTYDVILADFALPDFDGMSALRIVRERDANLPFIFVSGVLGEEVAVDALQQGATDYVLKQRLDRLLPSVERALREARGRAERDRSEAALRRSERFCEQILESTQDCVMTVDREGNLLTINRGGRAAVGLEDDEQVTTYRWPELWKDSTAAEAALRLAAEQGSANFEGAALTRDGRTRWYDVVVTPLAEPDQTANRMLAVARDVTERHELLGSERRSRSDAEEKARELEKSLLDLESYAFVASHDLQEPVRVIRTYAQLLERRCGSELDPSCRQFLGYIEENASRMTLLIRDLLAYSRVVHQDEQIETLDTEQILDDVLSSWSAAIQETGLQVSRHPMAPVVGVRSQIRQVFHNLIENAIKYRNDSNPMLEVGSMADGSLTTFYVRDNGIGFDPRYAGRIFQIFKRLHGKEYPGSGVGLAICKRVVERHGGRIWAESGRGEGSSFFFTLPTADVREPASRG